MRLLRPMSGAGVEQSACLAQVVVGQGDRVCVANNTHSFRNCTPTYCCDSIQYQVGSEHMYPSRYIILNTEDTFRGEMPQKPKTTVDCGKLNNVTYGSDGQIIIR